MNTLISSARDNIIESLCTESREYQILNKIVTEFSQNDNMLKKDFSSAKHYLRVGLSAIHCIDEALQRCNKDEAEVKAVLDLPCGYGRVLRAIQARFPKALLHACEIIEDAIEYCSTTFSAIPIQSHENISRVDVNTSFDLIWCGSLITHLDEKRTVEVLKFFFDHLNDGGICIFTTHGLGSVNALEKGTRSYGLEADLIRTLLSEYKKCAFGYVNYSNSKNYGISLSSTQRILEICYNIGNWKNVYFKQEGWDKHQDVFAFTKN